MYQFGLSYQSLRSIQSPHSHLQQLNHPRPSKLVIRLEQRRELLPRFREIGLARNGVAEKGEKCLPIPMSNLVVRRGRSMDQSLDDVCSVMRQRGANRRIRRLN